MPKQEVIRNLMKKYRLYWLDGKVEIITGLTIADAFRQAGYGGGAIRALDWHEEISETPLKNG